MKDGQMEMAVSDASNKEGIVYREVKLEIKPLKISLLFISPRNNNFSNANDKNILLSRRENAFLPDSLL